MRKVKSTISTNGQLNQFCYDWDSIIRNLIPLLVRLQFDNSANNLNYMEIIIISFLAVGLTIVMSIYVVDDGSVSSSYVFLRSSKSTQQRVEFDPNILTGR